MVDRVEAIVLGVGGMGAAALAHLARRGVSCVGVEQDDVPSARGSSVGETRVIRKAYFEDARYVPLLERAYVLWRELELESKTKLFERIGCMTIAPRDHAATRGVMESVTRHRLPHEVLDAKAIASRFPAIVPNADDVAVLEEDAGYLRVEECTRAHAAWAIANGAELRTRARVAAIAIDAERVRVTLDDGAEIVASKLVVSAGAWLASSSALAPVRALVPRLPLAVERQVQLWFAPPADASSLPAFIHFTGDRAYYAIPTRDAFKACRHHGGEPATPDALDRALRAEDEADVRGYLASHAPRANGALLRSRVCMYTNTPDEHFVVGRVAPNVVVLGGFSGHGYKMASAIGDVAAELVTRGSSPLDLGMFDPRRFC